MKKEFIKFFEDVENQLYVLKLSASDLSEEDFSETRETLVAMPDVFFQYIDQRNIGAVITGRYSDVLQVMTNLEKSGWSWN